MRAILMAVFWLGVAAVPAAAQDMYFFQSPSGNIHCAMSSGMGSGVRCDLWDLEYSFPDAPDDCDQDWGFAFAVEGRGVAEPICVGDSVVNENADVLDYGRSVTWDSVTCTSRSSGVTCTNLDGHGFTVAKARQTLF